MAKGYNTYIGARYIPIFAGQWNNTKGYEPLTVVEYQGNSYTSKTYVPIGANINDTTYWAETGNYNAQVEAYREEVLQFIAQTENLNGYNNIFYKKKVVVYGDSLCTSGQSFIKNLQLFSGASSVVNRGVPSTRMYAGNNSGYSLINGATDLNNFDYLILVYGTNEWQSSAHEGTLGLHTKKLIDLINTKTQSVRIIFCLPPYSYRNFGTTPNVNNVGLTLDETNCVIAETLKNLYNIPVVDFFNHSTCNSTNYINCLKNDSGGIFVHPTDSFAQEMTKILMKGATGFISCKRSWRVIEQSDFYINQARINMTEWNGGVASLGINIGINPKETAVSEYKTWLTTNDYLLTGKADGAVTIEIGDSSWEVNGYFRIYLPFGHYVGFSPIKITNNGDSKVIIKNLNCLKGGINDLNDNHNRHNALQKTEIITEGVTQGATPVAWYIKDSCLRSNYGGLNVTTEITNGTPFLSFGENLPLLDSIVVLYSKNGTALAELRNRQLTAVGNIPVGFYYINLNIGYPKNIKVINNY